ncbi:tetraspanin-7-like [Dreissena polymorpha]|uniref:Tetraspanin n=1 Tax=Dreissena polymorpha TaxID=45954 RepID=A0A9D4RJ48_DREPO|nr:tetraspanin-7-like [Dreissena polymorpha]KAH3868322.1 hypothetical protein DPMN_031465 [Dreissena polymorpha]
MAKNPLSCGSQCNRVTLIILNIIFLLCGIALFVVGLIFRFGGDSLKKDVRAFFSDIDIIGYDFYDLVEAIAIIFIVMGAIIIGFSLLGFIGAACYVRWVLIFYAVLVFIILALELAGVILFFIVRKDMEKALRVGMEESIKKANEGQKDFKDAAEYMFLTFDCCHVTDKRLNYTDGNTSNDQCSTSKTEYGVDCYDSFTTLLKRYQGALVGVCIGVMCIQLMIIILACCLCRAFEKRNAQLV